MAKSRAVRITIVYVKKNINMRFYKRMTYVSAIVLFISFVTAFTCEIVGKHFFIENVCLAIFGGTVLSLITSILGYYNEKRQCMEAFFAETLRYLNKLNKYQYDLNIEQKIRFFLNLSEYNLINWDLQYGRIDFWNNNYRAYIFYKIYTPINELNKEIKRHEWHFRMYVNGTGRNEKMMEVFLMDLDAQILDIKLDLRNDESVPSTSVEYVHNAFYETLTEELMGQYRKIMYGWY